MIKISSKCQKANNIDEKFKEDLEFAKRTEEAWKMHDKGEFKRMDFDDFIKEIKSY